VTEAAAVDLDDRLTLAGDPVPEVDAVDLDLAFQSDLRPIPLARRLSHDV
jgi:hypothetical protein